MILKMRVLELFSGIGGMHFALKESGVDFNVVSALDINTTANEVYKFNFPGTKLMQNNIQCLTADLINGMDIDTITMSPPCQPFTRLGLKKGSDDNRNSALSHILDLLPNLYTLRYILLENVVGFESSSTREEVITALQKSGFRYQEFHLNPLQFSIPNSRNRYYLLAKKNNLNFIFQEKNTIHNELPEFHDSSLAQNFEHQSKIRNIESILDETPGPILPDKIIKKYSFILDIVFKDSAQSCCFTKGYSHYTEGTGSVFCPFSKEKIDHVYKCIKDLSADDENYLKLLKSLELRYFSPQEVARLMCFPAYFQFPDTISLKQKYRLLGNSINVYVVSLLIKLLIN